jgi:hypothetical protein
VGHPYVSDSVFDEAITLAGTRTGSVASAERPSDRLRGRDDSPRVFEMRRVSTAVFADAVPVVERYVDHQPGVTDATTVALTERHGIDRW